MRHKFLTDLILPLWDPAYLESLQDRYRKKRENAKEIRRQRLAALGLVITDEWERADVLAIKAGIPDHSATKLLHRMYRDGIVECQRRDWEDEKHRERTYFVYRKRRLIKINLLNSVFGVKVPQVDMRYASVTRHVLEDE